MAVSEQWNTAAEADEAPSSNNPLIQTDILLSHRTYLAKEFHNTDESRSRVGYKPFWNMFTVSELFVLLAVLSATASGYFVSIDAHAEECFNERANSGTKMGLMFEVAEGGFLDIDVEVW